MPQPAGALYAAMPLMRTRGQLTTFQNLQQPVQQLCGRNFTVCSFKGLAVT